MSAMMRMVRSVEVDKAMAAGTAALAAVAVLLIPADILSNAVARTGLDVMFAPLQPPLGARARIGLALLVAGIVFGIVLAAMSLLDRAVVRRAATPRGGESEDTPPAPRLRRRDSHPDAPPRAPFSPVSELGAPEMAIEEAESRAARLRRWRADLVEADDELDHEPDHEAEMPAPWSEPDIVEVAAEAPAEPDTHEADPFLERPPVAVAPVFVPSSAPPIAATRAPIIAQQEPAISPQPGFTERRVGERRRPEPEPLRGGESIAELMARLERVLGSVPPPADPPPAAPVPVRQDLEPATMTQPDRRPDPAPDPWPEPGPIGDDRLRSAIEHLRRAASRG